MTNQEKFIQIFGIVAWQAMIVPSGLAEQFKEYWTSPYNNMSCRDCKEPEATIEGDIKELFERVENIERLIREEREERLEKLKAEADFAKFCCTLRV